MTIRSSVSSPYVHGSRSTREPCTFPLAAGLGLILYAVGLATIAAALDAGVIDRAIALLWVTAASVAAGLAYLLGLTPPGGLVRAAPMTWTIGIAVAARLVVIASPPLQESDRQDYQRYLWDGAVAAHGISPYRHAPGDIAAGVVSGGDASRLDLLARDGRDTLAQINHPHLTTIYPPLAQAGFLAAHVIDPFGVTGWRLILLMFDALTVVILICLLRAMDLPSSQIAWYALNPLLLRETYSSLHMDVLALPWIATAVFAGLRSRHLLGAVLCIAASAVKVWPLLLAPLLLRPLAPRWRALAAGVAVSIAAAALLWAPMWAVASRPNSGLVAYAQSWQSNDGFFRAGLWLTSHLLELTGAESWRAHRIMQVISVGLVLATLVVQARTMRPDGRDLPRRCLVVVGALFMLSPTQFPWYWIWCLPLLTIHPARPLLLYAALLPLYYVQDRVPSTVWIEHVPVWALLAFDLLRSRRAPRTAAVEPVHA